MHRAPRTALRADAAGADTSNLLVNGTTIVPPPPGCTGDLNNDGATNVLDFSIFTASFGQAVTPGTNGDFDNSGFVDVLDFSIFAADFGCTS